MLENAFCLCASCHRIFTDNPVDFSKFVLEKIGDAGYAELLAERNRIDKVDWEEEACRLKKIVKDLEL
jgi:hypothetical protein